MNLRRQKPTVAVGLIAVGVGVDGATVRLMQITALCVLLTPSLQGGGEEEVSGEVL